MCGIAGIISIDPSMIQLPHLQAMSHVLRHRGPDGDGHWINSSNTAGFAHRRLAIIDLSSTAAQPMHYANRFSIVYNGEIYNYIEVRDKLISLGFRFHTQSDTEVILAAYACWKADLLQHLDGMFAFAIWDEQEQELFAARDRFGEKPFFYALHEGRLVFGSEMKALWAVGVAKNPDENMLFNYLSFGYLCNPEDKGQTFFKGIRKIPAGNFLRFRAGENAPAVSVYWQLEKNLNTRISDAEAIENFQLMFHESIRKRLRSDVAIGTSLSGGLDSSAVVATIRSIAPALHPATYSAVFPGSPFDESEQVRIMTQQFELPNKQVTPTIDDFISSFEALCYHQEEPFQSASIFAQYDVYKLAAANRAKVLLDGQGADEMLAGYHKYYPWYWREESVRDKEVLKKELKAAAAMGIDQSFGVKDRIAAAFPVIASRYQQWRSGGHANSEISKDFQQQFGKSNYHFPPGNSLQDLLYYNTVGNGLEDLLRFADRSSMAHGVEVRLPFLQHELVQFIFSLPSSFKIRDGYTKWLLRKSMSDMLPQQIAWSPLKIGFEPPQENWMRDPRMIEKMMAARKKLVTSAVLDTAVLNKKIQPQASHAADNFDWRYLVSATLLG